MKISIITTVNHNVGDDFVREGLKFLLKKHFKGEETIFTNIHKHSPITARYGFESFRGLNFRHLRLPNRIDKIIPKNWTNDRILEADLVVQSGAPVYWCHDLNGGHCYDNEWYHPLIKERFMSNGGAKLLNLAAGTCQTYHSTGEEFCEKCSDYIKEFYVLSDATSVRDSLAKDVFRSNGLNVPVIPCSSIFAVDEHGIESNEGEYVVVNYMKGGAHYTLGQNIKVEEWEREFKAFYFDLKSKEKVIIVCHNQKEVDEAIGIDKKANIFYKKDDYLAYMRFYSKAKFGIMNRVHAAFLMASLGKPSVVIGNDSRARMAEEIGLKHYFVNDVNFEVLSREYGFLKAGTDGFREKFERIKGKALDDYMELISAI